MNGNTCHKDPQTVTSWDDLPLVLTVEDLYRHFALGKNLCYELASKLGIRVGRRILVPKQRLRQWLEDRDQG